MRHWLIVLLGTLAVIAALRFPGAILGPSIGAPGCEWLRWAVVVTGGVLVLTGVHHARRARTVSLPWLIGWLVVAVLATTTVLYHGAFAAARRAAIEAGHPSAQPAARDAFFDALYRGARTFTVNIDPPDAPDGRPYTPSEASRWLGSPARTWVFWVAVVLAPLLVLGGLATALTPLSKWLRLVVRRDHLVVVGKDPTAFAFAQPEDPNRRPPLRQRPVVVDIDGHAADDVRQMDGDLVLAPDFGDEGAVRRARVRRAVMTLVSVGDDRANRRIALAVASERPGQPGILFQTRRGVIGDPKGPDVEPVDAELEFAERVLASRKDLGDSVAIVGPKGPLTWALLLAVARRTPRAEERKVKVVGDEAGKLVRQAREESVVISSGIAEGLERLTVATSGDALGGYNEESIRTAVIGYDTVLVALADDNTTLVLSESIPRAVPVVEAHCDDSAIATRPACSVPRELIERVEKRRKVAKKLGVPDGVPLDYGATVHTPHVVLRLLSLRCDKGVDKVRERLDKYFCGLEAWPAVAVDKRPPEPQDGLAAVIDVIEGARCSADAMPAPQGMSPPDRPLVVLADGHGCCDGPDLKDVLHAALCEGFVDDGKVLKPTGVDPHLHLVAHGSRAARALRDLMTLPDQKKCRLTSLEGERPVHESRALWKDVAARGETKNVALIAVLPKTWPTDDDLTPWVVADIAFAQAFGIKRIAVVVPDADLGEATSLLSEHVPSLPAGLRVLPLDRMTLRAWLREHGEQPGPLAAKGPLTKAQVEGLAQHVHEQYVKAEHGRRDTDDDAMQPWVHLPPSLRDSNVAVASDWANKVAAVQAVTDYEDVLRKLPAGDAGADGPDGSLEAALLELLAEMEHGRYVNERIGSGWRYGNRDTAIQRTSALLTWEELGDLGSDDRRRDRENVRAVLKWLDENGLL